MSIGCKIVLDFKRPSTELIERFREIPVANLDDCMGRTAAVRAEIVPMGKPKLLGPAFTVKVPEGDNLMFHKAMDLAKPGDVIVIDAGGSIQRSIFGELMAHYCKLRGIAGLAVDGSIRDAAEIAAMDYPVYARGVTPNGPYKNGPGEINTVISFGGKIVHPGDIVVADADGMLFVRPEEAEVLLKDANAVMEKEAKIMKTQLERGTYDRPWVDEKLKEIGCEIKEHA